MILDLSLEIHRQIYQLLIIHPEPINQLEPGVKTRDLRETHNNYLALSRSCHQIRDEVRLFSYSDNIFSFEFQEWPDKGSIPDPDLRFLQFWRDASAGGSHLMIPQIAKCLVSITAPTCLEEDLRQHIYGQTLCMWLSRAPQIRTLHVCLTNFNLRCHFQPPIKKFSKSMAIRENLERFKGLGLLGPFGQLRNVETFIIEGDVPAEYRTNLRSKMQGLEPTWPLPDMFHALKLYVFSYATPLAARRKGDFKLVNAAFKAAADGDMGKFTRFRREVKKLGDICGLDSVILYANDPKPTTMRIALYVLIPRR